MLQLCLTLCDPMDSSPPGSSIYTIIHRGRPQTTSTRLYAGGELQGSPVWQALAGHKRRIPLAVVLPPPARGLTLNPQVGWSLTVGVAEEPDSPVTPNLLGGQTPQSLPPTPFLRSTAPQALLFTKPDLQAWPAKPEQLLLFCRL